MLETLLPEQTYFSIGEVSQLTGIKPYVIRYWESQFSTLRPPRRDSGQRKFTQKDVDAILHIKNLLYEKKYTIAGAKSFLKQEARRGNGQLKMDLGEPRPYSQTLDAIRGIRKDLEDALKILKQPLSY